jgi:hypothetical protein
MIPKEKVDPRPLHESFYDELRQASALSKGKLVKSFSL